MIRLTGPLLIAILLTQFGCTVAPNLANSNLVFSRDYSEDFDDVWNATIETMIERNTIKQVAKDSGLITTEKQHAANFGDPAYMDCGKAGILIHDQVRFSYTVLVRVADESSINVRVKTDAAVQRSFHYGHETLSTQWYPCYSRGFYENAILDRIDRHLENA